MIKLHDETRPAEPTFPYFANILSYSAKDLYLVYGITPRGNTTEGSGLTNNRDCIKITGHSSTLGPLSAPLGNLTPVRGTLTLESV